MVHGIILQYVINGMVFHLNTYLELVVNTGIIKGVPLTRTEIFVQQILTMQVVVASDCYQILY